MPLVIRRDSGLGQIVPLAAGTYAARLVTIADIGTQLQRWDRGTKSARQLVFTWELPGELVTIGGEQKPRQLSRTFTMSLSKKASLYQFLTAWGVLEDGADAVDLEKLLGHSCLVSVAVAAKKDGGAYNKVTAALAAPAGMAEASSDTEPVLFSMDAWDDAALARLPDWLQKKIEGSEEFLTGGHLPAEALSFPELTADADEGGDAACPF